MPHPPFHMEKEGGANVGFIKQNKSRHCNKKIDKKIPTHPFK